MPEYNFRAIKNQKMLTREMVFLLSELDREFFPTPWSFDSWQDLFFENERLLVLLFCNESVIGFCLFNISPEDSFAHLLKILIHPEKRHIGLASILLNKATSELDEIGCSKLYLEVEENNYAAISLYSSSGFHSILTKKNFYGEGRSALIMTRGQ